MDFYKLDYSGQEVNAAIGRILEEDPSELENTSHIKNLDSTETVPYNLNTLVMSGIYRCMFVDPDCVPAEVSIYHPLFIVVSSVEDSSSATGVSITQSIVCGLKNYQRMSKDDGSTWLEWEYPKEISADEVLAMFTDEGIDADLLAHVMEKLVTKTSTVTQPVTTTMVRRKSTVAS